MTILVCVSTILSLSRCRAPCGNAATRLGGQHRVPPRRDDDPSIPCAAAMVWARAFPGPFHVAAGSQPGNCHGGSACRRERLPSQDGHEGPPCGDLRVHPFYTFPPGKVNLRFPRPQPGGGAGGCSNKRPGTRAPRRVDASQAAGLAWSPPLWFGHGVSASPCPCATIEARGAVPFRARMRALKVRHHG